MNKKDEIINILKKFEQTDYKKGGVSLAPEMYNAVAEHIVKLFSQADVISSVCDHEFISREYSSQPYGTCLCCGITVFAN